MELQEAQDWFNDELIAGGKPKCPCCKREGKIYNRTITSGMARELIAFYKEYGKAYGYGTEVKRVATGREFAKLRYWGLIEEKDARREDGSPHAGWWRVTERGRLWICGSISVPKYAVVFDKEAITVQGSKWTIEDALGTKFDLEELLSS
jgi:hypothetical protein